MATVSSDLTIYYSGSNKADQPQDNPLQSLGGYRSTVIVPNGKLNSAFDNLGCYELQEGKEQIVCLFLKNVNVVDAMTNLALYIDGKQSFEQIKFGVSLPADNVSPVQLLSDNEQDPYNVAFYEAYEVGDKIAIKTNFDPEEILALWVKRIIPEDTPVAEYKNSLVFHFDWT